MRLPRLRPPNLRWQLRDLRDAMGSGTQAIRDFFAAVAEQHRDGTTDTRAAVRGAVSQIYKTRAVRVRHRLQKRHTKILLSTIGKHDQQELYAGELAAMLAEFGWEHDPDAHGDDVGAWFATILTELERATRPSRWLWLGPIAMFFVLMLALPIGREYLEFRTNRASFRPPQISGTFELRGRAEASIADLGFILWPADWCSEPTIYSAPRYLGGSSMYLGGPGMARIRLGLPYRSSTLGGRGGYTEAPRSWEAFQKLAANRHPSFVRLMWQSLLAGELDVGDYWSRAMEFGDNGRRFMVGESDGRVVAVAISRDVSHMDRSIDFRIWDCEDDVGVWGELKLPAGHPARTRDPLELCGELFGAVRMPCDRPWTTGEDAYDRALATGRVAQFDMEELIRSRSRGQR